MTLRRRDFITLLGCAAAAWPQAARAQKAAVPVIGYLSTRTQKFDLPRLAAVREGLSIGGYVEGKNVAIEYRFADGGFDRLPALAADLVNRKVALIFAASGVAAPAAKAATATIPIVFDTAGDPVQSGLVASLNRPGANLTGVTTLNTEVGRKRLEVLPEMVPTATTIALLVNPSNPGAANVQKEMEAAAAALGLQLRVLKASAERDIDQAFATLAELRAGALVIGTDTFFTSRSERLGELTVRHGVAAIYQTREFATAGGLMSYGGNVAEAYRSAGVYVSRILKGEKPADLPVQRITKVDLIINFKTAKALGLSVPLPLSGGADEVIE
jgi:putative ABC transport system substrate-binding protein